MSNARNLANLLGTGTTIASAKIADDAITNAKIANDAVTGAKIEDNPTIAGNLTIAGDTTAQGSTVGFVAFDRVLLNATDGSATDAGDFLVLNSTDGSADDGEKIIFETASGDPNFFNIAGSELFQVVLKDNQSSLSDNTVNVVDFGSKGLVAYDTKSNFDASNDAYEFASSDGVYLIAFSTAIRSAGVVTETLQDTAAFLEFSTDSFGSTLIGIDNQFGVATHMMDTNNDEEGSNTLSATFLYKVRFSNTKVRLKVYANTSGSANYTVAGNINSMLNGSPSDDTRCTALSVVRVA